ncbi:hypothetical protein SKAU_G00197640 [Synaphobranchus kaupii]|uniref:Uncharacterized protein n=1 Tax=Synaphobranchus kaupii TaxID=118154 RepID=A0A9Q1FEV2_SYNKA|nr:hypothetical protein SKAU_G00197640 [Synaphobranchus kaupii]
MRVASRWEVHSGVGCLCMLGCCPPPPPPRKPMPVRQQEVSCTSISPSAPPLLLSHSTCHRGLERRDPLVSSELYGQYHHIKRVAKGDVERISVRIKAVAVLTDPGARGSEALQPSPRPGYCCGTRRRGFCLIPPKQLPPPSCIPAETCHRASLIPAETCHRASLSGRSHRRRWASFLPDQDVVKSCHFAGSPVTDADANDWRRPGGARGGVITATVPLFIPPVLSAQLPCQ